MVAIPPSLSDSGKRERKFFTTRNEAEALCDVVNARKRTGVDYKNLVEMLPPGVTLLDAVEFYLEHHYRRLQSVPFSEAWEAYKATKTKHSVGTIREVRQVGKKLEGPLGGKLVSDITLQDLNAIILDFPDGSILKYRRVLSTFFNWAAHDARGWCRGNPAEKIEKPRQTKSAVRVLSNDDVKAILENAGDLLPFWVLCIFLGLRTTEAQRAFWSDINWDESHLKVRQEKGEFVTRYVDIQPNVMEWLLPFKGRTGVIVPFSRFDKKRRKTVADASVKPWGNRHGGGSVDRHTFASNHLAHFANIGSLTEQMGHSTEKMVREKYRRAVTKKDAAEFWEIRPASGS